MDSWAFHTGKLDAAGNYIDTSADPIEDKYWLKYMSDTSPYKEKYSPPKVIKSPNKLPKRKFYRGKKKPRWMTPEEYERLMIKSYSKKQTEESDEKDCDNNGGILRWPEILQQRPISPISKRNTKKHQKLDDIHDDDEDIDINSELDELNLISGYETMKGSYRPSSAPLGKTPVKNLFQKDDLLGHYHTTTNPTGTTTTGGATQKKRPSTSNTYHNIQNSNTNKTKSLQQQSKLAQSNHNHEKTENPHENATYIIDNEEEAIQHIQSRMLHAAVQNTIPVLPHKYREELEERDYTDTDKYKIGKFLLYMCMYI